MAKINKSKGGSFLNKDGKLTQTRKPTEQNKGTAKKIVKAQSENKKPTKEVKKS